MLSKFPKLGTGEERARERFGRRDLTFGNSPVMILLSLLSENRYFPHTTCMALIGCQVERMCGGEYGIALYRRT